MKSRQIIITLLASALFLPCGLLAQETISLREAIETGLENRHSILIMQNEAEIASINHTPGNAGMLPSLSLSAGRNASLSTVNQRTLSGDERELSNARSGTWSAGASLNWTLFDGFGMFIERDRLAELESRGETELRMEVESTVAEITIAYYSIVQQEEIIMVLKEATTLSRERVKIARARSALGAGARPALLQATVDLHADSARLISESSRLTGMKANLNLLMGRDPATALCLSDSISEVSLPPFEELWSKADSQGNELILARQSERLSELQNKALRSYLYPRIDLSSGYSYNRSNAQAGYLSYNRAYGPSYGLTLSYPIFNGFNAQRELQVAEIDLRSESLRMEDTRLSIRTEMFSIYHEFKANLDLIALETYNVEVATENVLVAMEKYRLGAISDIELRETQKKLIDAQYELLLSKFRAVQAETEIRRMCGMLRLKTED